MRCATGALLLLLSQPLAWGQIIAVDRFPTGSKPAGVGRLRFRVHGPDHVATANSGDNSVSLFRVAFDQSKGAFSLTAEGNAQVPAPHAVIACEIPGSGLGFLITSSSGNSVTWMYFSENGGGEITGTMLKTINVGPQPYAAGCFDTSVLVSTLGDNVLSVIDIKSGLVTARIPNVPGSRALHGIVVDRNNNAWVAGTDANVVTIVSLTAGRVLASIPIRQPIAVGLWRTTEEVYVASAGENTATFFNCNTLQVLLRLGIPANAQDFVPNATTSGNSVVVENLGQIVGSTVIPDIPGAFGLDLTSLGGNGATGIFVASRDSNSIFLIQTVRVPQAFSVTNAASFAPGIAVAPGSLSSVFADTQVAANQSATSLPLPTSLAGVSLRVGGTISYVTNSGLVYSPNGSVLAPLLFVGPRQINFQIPAGMSGDAVPVQLRRPDGTTVLSNVRVAGSAPGIFTVLASGSGPGAVLNQDNSLNLPTRPASRGTVIQIYATGTGTTNPAVAAGVAAPANPLALTVAQPTVTIGGRTAQLQFSGLAPGFVGLWQINAVIPADVTPGNAVSLSVAAGGQTSNTVTIAVQ